MEIQAVLKIPVEWWL